MFEHVGAERMGTYFGHLHELIRPGGRLLNHAISRPAGQPPGINHDGFIGRYVFPDGELIEVGAVVTAMQKAGFEVRHEESLREHYARTLRHWVANLELHWDDAVAEVGAARARIWRLYMAGSAAGFEANRIQIHQVLGDVTGPDGNSGFPLRPDW
jgi:cyclopropane-fatty-acyl-phospholipid synthase